MTVILDQGVPSQQRAAAAASAGRASSRATTPVSVVVATPFGAGGRGGMDRLTDLILEQTGQGAFGTVGVSRLTVRGGGGHVMGALIFASAVLRLIYLCALGHIHLLHLNVAVYGSFYRKFVLSRVVRCFGIPYAVHIHSGRFEQFWSNASPSIARRVDTFLQDSACILVLGNVYRELIAARLPGALARVAVLPNATQARAARSEPHPGEPVRITFLGRLGSLKGTPQLIEALGQLSPRPGWAATLAGNGDVEESRRRIAELGIADRVALPGWLGSADVDRLLASTDVLILPSFSEGLPMAIIEAFAAGIPVIATPVNAVVDVVQHERNGLLVEPGNVGAIAAALARLIEDPGLRRRLGERARLDHAERYDQKAYMERLIALWQTVATRP